MIHSVRATPRFLPFLFAAVILCALLGCESAVDPIVGEERPFTVWGLLDAAADTQEVRVFTIEDQPGIHRETLEAMVESTDLTTGERRAWHHRTVTYDSGAVGHVYRSAFRAEHGHTYRLEVTASDGAASTATVTVPDGVEVVIDNAPQNALIPVTITGDAPNLIGVGMRYESTNFPPLDAPPGVPLYPLILFPVEVSYQDDGERVPGGWRFIVSMSEDAVEVRDVFERNCLVTPDSPGITLRRVEFHFIVASEAWRPPGGDFDPEVLIQPGALSNVENGYGFIGAGEIVRFRWTPEKSLRSSLGFVEGMQAEFGSNPPQPCVGGTRENIWDLFR